MSYDLGWLENEISERKEVQEKILPEEKKIDLSKKTFQEEKKISKSKLQSINEIEELKRLVNIHETFFKNQYEYDKSLIMKRFEKLEREILALTSKKNTI